MTKTEFLKYANITEAQFLGYEPIPGSLDLGSLTSIPEGFNPTVGGSLDLESLTSIPEGFNPTVGGYLDLGSLTSIPEGFNPTVGGSLDLGSLTSIPEGFNQADFENKEIPFMEWKKNGKHYILADGVFSEVVKKKGSVFYLASIGKKEYSYLVTDGNGKYAHGKTVQEAKADLIYKIGDRDKSKYNGLDVAVKMPYEKCIEMYRVITGACSAGVRGFIESAGIKAKKYSVQEIAKLTEGRYGNSEFNSFFGI